MQSSLFARIHRWQSVQLWLWLLVIGGFILYLLLRPSPSASGLPMTPHWLIDWLNKYHDLRTLPMAFGYAIIPALLLRAEKRQRRIHLLIILLILVSGEVAQLAIPTRRFTWPDVFYSIIGVGLAEAAALVLWKAENRKLKADWRL